MTFYQVLLIFWHQVCELNQDKHFPYVCLQVSWKLLIFSDALKHCLFCSLAYLRNMLLLEIIQIRILHHTNFERQKQKHKKQEVRNNNIIHKELIKQYNTKKWHRLYKIKHFGVKDNAATLHTCISTLLKIFMPIVPSATDITLGSS